MSFGLQNFLHPLFERIGLWSSRLPRGTKISITVIVALIALSVLFLIFLPDFGFGRQLLLAFHLRGLKSNYQSLRIYHARKIARLWFDLDEGRRGEVPALRDTNVHERLIADLKSKHKKRYQVIPLLTYYIGGPRSKKALMEALEDENPKVRLEALKGLRWKHFYGRDVENATRRMLDDPDPYVAKAAHWWLDLEFPEKKLPKKSMLRKILQWRVILGLVLLVFILLVLVNINSYANKKSQLTSQTI